MPSVTNDDGEEKAGVRKGSSRNKETVITYCPIVILYTDRIWVTRTAKNEEENDGQKTSSTGQRCVLTVSLCVLTLALDMSDKCGDTWTDRQIQ